MGAITSLYIYRKWNDLEKYIKWLIGNLLCCKLSGRLSKLWTGRTAATAFINIYESTIYLDHLARECMIGAVLFLLECFSAMQFVTDSQKCRLDFFSNVNL